MKRSPVLWEPVERPVPQDDLSISPVIRLATPRLFPTADHRSWVHRGNPLWILPGVHWTARHWDGRRIGARRKESAASFRHHHLCRDRDPGFPADRGGDRRDVPVVLRQSPGVPLLERRQSRRRG